MTPAQPARPATPGPDWVRLAALAGLTLLSLYVCWLLVAPFLPAVAWGVALAVIGLPLHRRLRRATGSANFAAAVTTLVVVVGIGVPVVLVAMRLSQEAGVAVETVREQATEGRWRDSASRVPYVGDWVARLDAAAVEHRVREAVEELGRRSFGMIEGAIWAALQIVTALFILFFCFRDRHHLVNEVSRLLPLAPADADRVMDRAEGAIHATVNATLAASAVQAVTGGLLFWAIGLPAPVLWGVVMFVLGVLPFVGAFIVWVPMAVVLASEDRWGDAAAVVAWGVLMAGVICYWIYAWIAGDRMRLHPVPSLLAFVGGLAVFGVSGMVLGPCALAVAVTLLDVWRYRLPANPAGPTAPPLTNSPNGAPAAATPGDGAGVPRYVAG